MAAAPFDVQNILVDEVFVIGDRRAADEAAVTALAESIKSIGLQTPITVRGDDTIADPETGEIIGGYRLVAGRHRLEAYRSLGHDRIPAVVRECDEIDAGLWEIDENLCRSELTEAEEARCLAKRKELWTAREAREARAAAEDNIVPSGDKKPGRPKTGDYARDTAKIIGESKTSVARKTDRGEKIAPDVLDAITGGRWDKGVVLDILKKLTHQEQRQALFRVQHGSSPSFADAYDFIKGEPPTPRAKPTKVIDIPAPKDWSEVEAEQKRRLMQAWNTASPGVQQWFRETVVDTPIMDRSAA